MDVPWKSSSLSVSTLALADCVILKKDKMVFDEANNQSIEFIALSMLQSCTDAVSSCS